MRHGMIALLFSAVLILVQYTRAAEPATTITDSSQVLAELVAIPGNEIPAALLAEAQGLAIIPRVIKVGFVAGVRRGHGVVLSRGADGSWSLPRFVTLTGASLGWQAGVQGTDVVLVFTTQRSVEGLLKGKFTIGVDAAAAAGPVGRNASAATDTSLRAEILSYSRSRGLFLGASVDGSAIEFDNGANTAFYGSPDPGTLQAVPLPAVQLQTYVTQLTGGARVENAIPGTTPPGMTPPGATQLNAVTPATAHVVTASGHGTPAMAVSPERVESLRQSLVVASTQLSRLINPEWSSYLALPPEIQNPAAPPNLAALGAAFARFEEVSTGPKYRDLAALPEFQTTRQLLREYLAACQTAVPPLVLPTPPASRIVR